MPLDRDMPPSRIRNSEFSDMHFDRDMPPRIRNLEFNGFIMLLHLAFMLLNSK